MSGAAAVRLLGRGLLLAVLAGAAIPSSSEAQQTLFVSPAGEARYTLSNEFLVGAGDRYRLREVVVNAGDSALVPERVPCETIEAEVEVPIDEPSKRCSDPPSARLEPGDSLWAEITGTVPEGWNASRGDRGLQSDRSPELRAVRVPWLLRFESRWEGEAVPEGEVRLVVRWAVRSADGGAGSGGGRSGAEAVGLAVSEAAADRMAATMPVLVLSVYLWGEDRYRIESCVRYAPQADAAPGCVRSGARSGHGSALTVGAILREEVSRRAGELVRRGARGRPRR